MFLSFAIALPCPVLATDDNAVSEKVHDTVSEEFLRFLLEFRDEKGEWVDPSALAVMDHPSKNTVGEKELNPVGDTHAQIEDHRNTPIKDKENTLEHTKESNP